jgi:flagellar basal-body rod modification protein FlgD
LIKESGVNFMAIPGASNSLATALQAQATASGSNSATNSQLVTEQSFLQLLITQLKNQDPLSPADPTQMVSQLASFSSLEQMTQLNTNMNTVLDNSAVSLIGQTVTVADNTSSTGFVTGQVTGIVYYSNGPAVQVNGSNYPLSAVQNVGTVNPNAPAI